MFTKINRKTCDEFFSAALKIVVVVVNNNNRCPRMPFLGSHGPNDTNLRVFESLDCRMGKELGEEAAEDG